jgi:hypothetical protein
MSLSDGLPPKPARRIRPLAWVLAVMIVLLGLVVAWEALVLTIRYAVRTA